MKRTALAALFLLFIASPGVASDGDARRSSARTVVGTTPGTEERLSARVAERRWEKEISRTLPTACPDTFDMIHYDLRLDVDHAAGTLDGDAFLTFRSLTDGLASIRLDLRQLAAGGVFAGGSPLAFTQTGDTLFVTLDTPLASGDTAIVEVVYGGEPGNEGGGGFGGFWIYPYPPTDFSMGVGLAIDPPSMGRFWFPGVDQPCDKATCEITATTNLVKTAVANGNLDTVIVDSTAGTRMWHWSSTYPMSTYLMALSIAKYDVIPDSFDTRIVYYVHRPLAGAAPGTFQNVAHMMSTYESLFGPYPYGGEKFSYVTTPIGDMEHQTCVFHSTGLMTGDTSYDNILAHEMSHQWYGDCVTYGDWRDVWLSEGFATYCEALWWEAKYGTAAYHDYVTSNLMTPYLANAANLTYPIYDPDFLWGTIAYEKGGTVLHMLRHVMGDSLFFAAMNEFKNAHAYDNAYTPDFQAACELVWGSDLSWFFDEWIYSGGHPVFDWGWTWEEVAPGSYRVDIAVRQVQSVGPTYTMPLDFRIQTSGGDTLVADWVNAPANGFSLLVDDAPVAVVLDPDDWLLDEATEIATGGPAGAPPIRFALAANRPNPFNPSTAIPFTLARSGPVSLRVYSPRGDLVRVLLSGSLPAGNHMVHWDGTDEKGRDASSGVYLVRLAEGGLAKTRKLHLVR